MIDEKVICASLRYCYGNHGKGCESCPGKNESGNGTCKIGALAADALEAMQAELKYTDALLEAERKYSIDKRQELMDMAADMVEQLPKRGEWIQIDKHTIQCPICRRYLDTRGVNAGRGDANYCPCCGAKMEEKDAAE